MTVLVIATGWFVIGLVGVAVMRHRGHDAFSWAVLFAFLGPLALPLAVSADRHPPAQPAAPVRRGHLDVLVEHNGSGPADAAVDAALELLGPQVSSVTVAVVVDIEAASTVRGRETQREAQARLDALAQRIASATHLLVDTVILFGQPTRTLERFAADHGYDLIVEVGSAGRRRGPRRRALQRRAAAPPVPVLVAAASQ